jgi:xanthine dehydrogenase YagS FAD-binding subunit
MGLYMRPFKFTNANSISTATGLLTKNTSAKFLAGGTNLIDLMKEDIERPNELVNVNELPLSDIKTVQGALLLGALAKNTYTANHSLVRRHFPLLSKAILAGASAQIRNMATNGGNLMQRTRCSYFYDVSMPCNKRDPGSGCAAIDGINRMHAIFGWSEKCVAVFPSDMAVALSALDAKILIQQADGQQRKVSITEFHKLPGDTPEVDNQLKHGELIIRIELPDNQFKAHSAYIKVRDRQSYAFALVSVAAGLHIEGEYISDVRLVMGGVAHKPWKLIAAEQYLKGKEASTENFIQAANIAMKEARVLQHNAFKVELGKRAIIKALEEALIG